MLASSLGYAVVMLGGNATVTLLFLTNAVFRGAGDPAMAMRMLIAANIINMALDPCLIFGLGPFPELGVTGAAVATNIGRGTAVVMQLWILLSGRSRVRAGLRHLRLVPAVMMTICRLSGVGFLQVLIDTSSWIGLVRVISTFGSDALAGYTIGIRVVLFAILPAWGLSNAAATMVGQALGAGKPGRAEEAVWTAGRYNALFLGLIGTVFLIRSMNKQLRKLPDTFEPEHPEADQAADEGTDRGGALTQDESDTSAAKPSTPPTQTSS